VFNKYCTLLSSKEWCINNPSGNDQTITVSYTSCFWAQLYDGHGCGGQDRSRTPLRVHSGGSWKLSSGMDAPSNCWCPANPKLKLRKNVLLQFSKLEMADVLAVDCISESDLFSIWYEKLRMWWNLAQILVRRDGFLGLSWLPVPKIEHWSEKIAHVLLCKSELENVFCCFPPRGLKWRIFSSWLYFRYRFTWHLIREVAAVVESCPSFGLYGWFRVVWLPSA
jgi:hypothetical protein